MNIAIFHNSLDNIGGAEIVSLVLARELNADVYTTNIDKEKIEKMGFKDVLSRIYSIGKVPINPPLRQQMALWKFRKLNLSKKYHFYIVTGDWAISGVVNNKPNVWYAESPIREIWDLYQYTKQNIVAWYQRPFFSLWVFYNRYLNKKYVMLADAVVCNSINTKNRLKKYFNRDANVINPPTETSYFFYKPSADYWLSVNRFITHKRIDMQLEAFAKLDNQKLIIVGSYEKAGHFTRYMNYCKTMQPKNVQVKSWINQQELSELYANCKGFITTSYNEDYGMNVVEAMASGKPVIAPNEGGYKETIINGKTGILIDEINKDKLIDAIKKIDEELDKNSLKYKDVCQQQAGNFDTKNFIHKIKEQIKK